MPKRKLVESSEEAEDDEYLSFLPVKATGALPNIQLEGCRPRTMGAIISVNKIVRPCTDVLLQIKSRGEWPLFLARCLKLPGFRTSFSTSEEMEQWLNTNSQSKSTFLGEEGDEQITVSYAGKAKSQFLVMGDSVTNPKGFTAAELEALVPRPEKTKPGKKHTLVLHRGGFRIADRKTSDEVNTHRAALPLKTEWPPLVLDLESGEEIAEESAVRLEMLKHKKFAVVMPGVGCFYEGAASRPRQQLAEEVAESKLGSIALLICKMTSGELKSMLQKLIRFSSEYVVCGEDEERYETKEVLWALMECAIRHPGGFVPSLQTSVDGLVSFLKRLAVTMVEDAWTNELDLHQLLLGAAISQVDREWFPTAAQCTKYLNMGMEAYQSKRAVVYECRRAGAPIVLKPGCRSTRLERCSILLDMLRSFPWDLDMLRDVAKQEKKGKLLFEENPKRLPRPSSMCVEHYIDHHVAPHIAYYMHPNVLVRARERYNPNEAFGDMDDKHDKPYALLFRYVFHTCTGVNYRRQGKPADVVFNAIVQRAQAQLFVEQHGALLGLTPFRSNALNADEKTVVDFDIDPMALAAAIGHINVKLGTKAYYVFVTNMEPNVEFGVVRVPTRDQRDTEIAEEERVEAIQGAKDILSKKGVRLATDSLWGPRMALLWENNIYFRKAKDVVEPPVFTLSSQTLLPIDAILRQLSQASLPALRRLYRLTQGFVRSIEFPKITRNGGPDDKPVMSIDIETFQLCLRLHPLLELYNERYFRVTDAVVWFHVRTQGLEPLVKRDDAAAASSGGWVFHTDKLNRQPTAAQVSALEALQARDPGANLFVMETGAGKSYVAMRYLMSLYEHKQLPRHVLFVTPDSALEGVAREVSFFTPNFEIRSMLKSKKTELPLKDFTITLLVQDHMRLVGTLFDSSMAECFFILDEFHLCLCQKTQRTKFMQSLSACAFGFLALSATPVINNSIYDLSTMLAPIVPFEISPSNFFVAYSFAVNQKESCMLNRFQIQNLEQVEEVPSNHLVYWDLLPKSLGGNNTKRLTPADLIALLQMSQAIASEKMLQVTIQRVRTGDCVFLVGKTAEHVRQLQKSLIGHIDEKQIYCIENRNDAITLTEDSIRNPKDSRFRRYQIVIAPISCATGYSVPICNVQVSSLYPSNSAGRAQIRGRIKRLSSRHKHLTYITVVCGIIQKLIANKYDKNDSFMSVLGDLAENVST